MAAISIINNGEAMSSVRSKLNNVITEVNLLDPTDWIDYSATSTVVGWSSTSVKQIRYRVIGKQVFVLYNISGTSNSINTNFTLPYNSININENVNLLWSINNGINGTGGSSITINSNVVNFFYNYGNWTSSGSKGIYGQFTYQIA